jgi:chorismate mutase
MNTRLDELRNRIGAIDREIVAALAQRSRLGCPARPVTAPTAAKDDDLSVARVQAEYAPLVAEKICAREIMAADASACAAADRAVVDAVCRRLRVVLEIAHAKAAGQTPRFRALVAARDAAGLEQAILQPAIEEQVIARAVTLARELRAAGGPANFPDRVAAIYRDWIIPLARRVQVETLLAGK